MPSVANPNGSTHQIQAWRMLNASPRMIVPRVDALPDAAACLPHEHAADRGCEDGSADPHEAGRSRAHPLHDQCQSRVGVVLEQPRRRARNGIAITAYSLIWITQGSESLKTRRMSTSSPMVSAITAISQVAANAPRVDHDVECPCPARAALDSRAVSPSGRRHCRRPFTGGRPAVQPRPDRRMLIPGYLPGRLSSRILYTGNRVQEALDILGGLVLRHVCPLGVGVDVVHALRCLRRKRDDLNTRVGHHLERFLVEPEELTRRPCGWQAPCRR